MQFVCNTNLKVYFYLASDLLSFKTFLPCEQCKVYGIEEAWKYFLLCKADDNVYLYLIISSRPAKYEF